MASEKAFRANRDLAIFVEDLGAARAFYGEVLGLELVSESEAMLEFDAGKLCLFVVRTDGAAQGFTPSFDVADARAARRHLLEAGCEALQDGEGGGAFRDPFGFVFDVMERRSG